ncbi:hypothetical protein RB595_005874 [Gaeumannomyces hyphopodioides]
MEVEASAADGAIQSGQLASNLTGQSYVHGVPLSLTTGIELNVLKAGPKLFGSRGGKSSFPGIRPSPEELEPKPDSNSVQGYIWVGMAPSDQTLANHTAAVAAMADIAKGAGANGGGPPGPAEATTNMSAKKGRRPAAGWGELLPPINNDPSALRVVVNKSAKNLQFYKLVTRDASTNICVKETVPKENVFFFPSFLGPDVRGMRARKAAVGDEIDKRSNGTGSGTTTLQSKQPKAAGPAAKTPGPGKVDKTSAEPNPPKTPNRPVAERSKSPAIPQSSTLQKESQGPGKVPNDKASGCQSAQIAQPKNGFSAEEAAAIALQPGINGAQLSALVPPAARAEQAGIKCPQPVSFAPSTALTQQEMFENRRPQNGNVAGWPDAPLGRALHHPVATPSTEGTAVARDVSPLNGYTSHTSRFAPDFAETPCRPHQPGSHLSQRPPSSPPSSTKTLLDTSHCNNAFEQDMARDLASSWSSGATGNMQLTNSAYGQDMARNSASPWTSGPAGNMQPTNNVYGKDMAGYPVSSWTSGATGNIHPANSPANSHANDHASNHAISHAISHANGAADSVNEQYIPEFQMHPPTFATGRAMQASNGGYGQGEVHYGGSSTNQRLAVDPVSGFTRSAFRSPHVGNVTGFPPGYADVHMQHHPSPSDCDSMPVQCESEGDYHPQDYRRLPHQRPHQSVGRPWRQTVFGGGHRNHPGSQLGWGGVRKSGTKSMHRRIGVAREDPTEMLIGMAMKLKNDDKLFITKQLVAIAQSIHNDDAFINLEGCVGAHFKCPAGELRPETVGPLYAQFMKMFPDLREDVKVAEFGFMLHGIREAKLMIEYKQVRQFVWAFVNDVRDRVTNDPAFSGSYQTHSRIPRDEAKKIAERARDNAGRIVPSPYDAENFASVGEESMDMAGEDGANGSVAYMTTNVAGAIGEGDRDAQ